MMNRHITSLILSIVSALAASMVPLAVSALESDASQPAVIDADAVDIDFAAGTRIYYGNVRFVQGTIRLKADKLEVYFKDSKLDHAVAVGNPAVVRQRPDGKEYDVIGEGQFIYLDEVNNIITLTRNASLTQGQDNVRGKTIVYNMATDKMQVRSGDTPTRTTKIPEGTAGAPPPPIPDPATSAATDAAASTENSASDEAATSDGEPKRPRIVLKPKPAE
ncbi:MAG: hypothetical protein DHS20C01_11690 [marine bacterium B5-7]|nr:MAG: hypothetical protein DHS20C01_11690 [marine bacterium B5-7]